jgi:hypothetical protein
MMAEGRLIESKAWIGEKAYETVPQQEDDSLGMGPAGLPVARTAHPIRYTKAYQSPGHFTEGPLWWESPLTTTRHDYSHQRDLRLLSSLLGKAAWTNGHLISISGAVPVLYLEYLVLFTSDAFEL